MSASDLHADCLAPLLETRRFGRSLDVRDQTESTNDDARKALVAGAPDGHVVVADMQSHGRGARGRNWESPAGSDLYLSIVARPGLPLRELPPLTLATGLGVARCLDTWAGDLRPEIKWPNDVLLGGKKLAGILVETVVVDDADAPGAVIGIGLNVGRTQFPELDFPATSMALALGEAPPRAQVLAALLGEVEKAVELLLSAGPEQVAAQVDARLAMVGREVMADTTRGRVLGVAADGHLRIETESGERRVSAGRLRPLD